MILQPKTFKSKKLQKNRKFRFFKNNFFFNFGTTGLFTTKPLFLTNKKIFKFKLILKRGIKKTDKTRRKFWFLTFPHLPLSKKFLGSRMGKGKGKLNAWYSTLSGGHMLVQFKNLRLGRSFFFLKKLRFQLNAEFKIFSKSSYFLKLPFKNKNYKILFNY